ncbi:MAG: hypothetical protein R2939_20205 [Kofleriaceae bacterium]
MPDDDEPRIGLAHAEATTEDAEPEQRVYLADGRQLAIVRDGGRQAVEFRAPSGQLELRVRLTEDGPVLSLETVRLEVRAAESVDIQCKDFQVTATESATIEARAPRR